MSDESDKKSLDVFGFGKIAKAIPPKVYERTATTLLKTFEQVTAPVTATTEGLGRYLRQKFDNMVDAEKAIATYTVEQAVERARARVAQSGMALMPPAHPKSFVRAIEEASKETDPLLHEMWANLLASQMSSEVSHPHFVEALTHFSPVEANLLVSLLPRSEIGENGGGYFYVQYDEAFTHWQKSGGIVEQNPWTLSCTLLCQQHFADVIALKNPLPHQKNSTILFRTALGTTFLVAVTPH